MAKNNSDYGAMLAILEYVDRKNKPGKIFRRKKDVEFDPVEYLAKKEAEVERLKKYFKDKDKLAPKEEPKAYQFTFTEGMLLAFFAQYLLGGPLSMMLKAYGVH